MIKVYFRKDGKFPYLTPRERWWACLDCILHQDTWNWAIESFSAYCLSRAADSHSAATRDVWIRRAVALRSLVERPQ